MVGLLVTLVTFTLLVALGVALLVAVTVVPVFVALQMADVRRFSTGRWGAASMAGVVLGLGLAYELHKHSAPRLLVVLPLLLTWVTPCGLWLLSEDQTRIGGRAGLHE
jgi:ABC-type Mn2+/Zn2+ transport system permease subunit